MEDALDTATHDNPVVVVIDDAEVLANCRASPALRHLLQHGFNEGTALVAAGDDQELGYSTEWLGELTKAHRGLLLAPHTSTSGRLIGIASVTPSLVGDNHVPGRGWLHLGDGTLLAVTIPH